MASVRFFDEEIRFKLPHPRKTTTWIKKVIEAEGGSLTGLNYIFCSDAYLRQINLEYLNHQTFTDIVTFNSSERGLGDIEGEIFISIDRVKENAIKFSTDFDQELHRVIIHGVLHLLGYSDKSLRQKSQMRKKEDSYLSLR